MKSRETKTSRNIVRILSALIVVSAVSVLSWGQYKKSELAPPPPPVPEYLDDTHIPDSIIMPSPVQTTLPREYADYAGREYAADLANPSNIKTEAVYNPATGMYLIHTKVGDKDFEIGRAHF